jgi:hypothetical protein
VTTAGRGAAIVAAGRDDHLTVEAYLEKKEREAQAQRN